MITLIVGSEPLVVATLKSELGVLFLLGSITPTLVHRINPDQIMYTKDRTNEDYVHLIHI